MTKPKYKWKPNPLLSADPATLPKYRKGTVQAKGGLLKYVNEVKPGPPPYGWRDITPYYGGIPESLGYTNMVLRRHGYYACTQIVTSEDGLQYRRVAVARISTLPVTKK